MKINFSLLKVPTLDGKQIDNTHVSLANALYFHTKDLSMIELARNIFAGKEVELSQQQTEEIKRIISDEKVGFFSFVQKALLDFIHKA